MVLNFSIIPSIQFQLSKEVLTSLTSIHFVRKSFALFSTQTFCSQFHSLISPSSTSCVKTHFGSKILFKNYLSQSVKHSFCEVGPIPTFSKFISPFSHSPHSILLYGHYDFNSLLFDDYCKFVFDPGGTIILVVVSL